MSEFNWELFLRQWGREMLESSHGREFAADVVKSGWLGFAGASEEEILAAEGRLGIALPPSFREFLRVSNGWRRTTFAIERVWGTGEINWFRKENKDWISAFLVGSSVHGLRDEPPDEEYFAYEQWAEDFRPKHFRETLQISEVGDAAVYLLNPQVISKDGEWEAWFFANWIPGAHRYRSFREMMEAEYAQFSGNGWKQPVGVIGELPDEYSGSPGSDKRKIKKRKPPEKLPPVEEMIAALGDSEATMRLFRKAAKVSATSWDSPEAVTYSKLVEALGRSRDPRAVDALIEHLGRKEYSHFRGEVIDALGRAKDIRAVEPLLGLLHGEGNMQLHASHVLKKLAPHRLAEPLLALLRERNWSFLGIAQVLGELGETRAVPLLVEIAKEAAGKEFNQCPSDVQLAAQMLAGFGRAGFEALVTLIRNNTSATVRSMAAGALYYSREPEAIDILTELLSDPNPDIRQSAEIAVSILPKRRKK
jgi:hypothetical protein